jgi:hypothetical protein
VGIQNFPSVLQPIIQQGYLERAFMQALRATLAYRSIAEKEDFPVKIGETLTKTRAGLLAAATTPLTPSANTNFDNGLSPQNWSVEQFTLTIQQYGATQDLNTVTNKVGIASQFIQNAMALGEQAARSLDALAANALFATYMGGNTRLRTTATGTSQAVDDVRGFYQVFNSNGVLVPVSSGNTLSITINGSAFTVTAVTADGNAPAGAPTNLTFSGSGSNVSTAPGGFSGVLTLSASCTGTAGQPVVSAVAPVVLRPNNRTTTAALTSGDTMLMINNVLQAATTLRLNAVPPIDGLYNCYADAQQIQGLFQDTAFQTLFRGAYKAEEYRTGEIFSLAGVRFIPTTMAPQQLLGGLNIRRALVVGKGALIEGDFQGQDAHDTDNPLAEFTKVDGVTHVTRAPMDRLQQIIAQSWYYIGGFVTPSDTTANPTTIPTASNAQFKRAVLIESL